MLNYVEEIHFDYHISICAYTCLWWWWPHIGEKILVVIKFFFLMSWFIKWRRLFFSLQVSLVVLKKQVYYFK